MTVVDAGAVVAMLTDAAALPPDMALLSAPHLIDSEVTNVLRRLTSHQKLTDEQADVAFEAYRRLVIRRWPVQGVLGRMWELRHNLSGYDASYVALAELLNESLLTTDRRLAGAPGIRCSVQVLAS